MTTFYTRIERIALLITALKLNTVYSQGLLYIVAELKTNLLPSTKLQELTTAV